MNTLTTLKNTVKSLTIAVTLVTGLALAPASAIADNDRGKHQSKDRDYTSKSHRDQHRDYGHKQHNNDNYRGHGKEKHYAHDSQRSHSYGHYQGYVVHRYPIHDHIHSYDYYDPRITLGLNLGQISLLFQD